MGMQQPGLHRHTIELELARQPQHFVAALHREGGFVAVSRFEHDVHAHMRVVGAVQRVERELQPLGRGVAERAVDARRDVGAARAHRLDRRGFVVQRLARTRELAEIDQELGLVVAGHGVQRQLAVAQQALASRVQVFERFAVAADHAAVQARIGADDAAFGAVDLAELGLHRQRPVSQC